MKPDPNLRPIVVKRIKKIEGGHHGGAWKIAYADFVTAMMAFFLLMWLLGSTSQGDKKGIEDFFQAPLKVALLGGSGTGEATRSTPGGGKDISASPGDSKRGVQQAQLDSQSEESIKRQLRRDARTKELASFSALKAQIENQIQSNPELAPLLSQILLQVTKEGLRISLIDQQERPMFAIGSAQLESHTQALLSTLAPTLPPDNTLILTGHTDSRPYTNNRNYSNWELSTDRANAARRFLENKGIPATRFLRVIGYSDSIRFHEDPLHPLNRRISLLILTTEQMQAVQAQEQNISNFQPLDDFDPSSPLSTGALNETQ